MTEDTFRHTEDDEERVVYHAGKIDEPIKSVLIHTRGGWVSLDKLLNGLRVKPEDIDGEELEGIVDEELLENNIPPGDQIYREYDKIKSYAAAAVMLAEAILTAEEQGYFFRFLPEEEVSAAQLEIEDFPSYLGLIKKRQESQKTVFDELRSQKLSLTQKAVLDRTKIIVTTQIPIAVFEMNDIAGATEEDNRERRNKTKHYLCIVNDGKHPPYFQLFSREKTISINESYYFNPMMAEDELMVYEHFRPD
ncbi:MAG: hypothetical protein KAT43_03595 [Nanoarchaeota archaeon]|nr:hypothetical protein [Nanoarchaeota archaeon]